MYKFSIFAVNNDEFEDEKIVEYKRKVIRIAENVIGLVVGIIALMLPLVMYIDDMYGGLPSESFWKYGLIYAGIALIIWVFVTTLINLYLSEFNVLKINEKQNKVQHRNLKLMYFCILLFVALVFVTTFIGGEISNNIYEGQNSISFETFAEFKEFMEQKVAEDGVSTYYDEENNVISEEEALTETITDEDGKVLCEFICYNQSVCGWEIGSKENNYMPIKVQTWEDVELAASNVSNFGSVGIIVYLLEAVAVGVLYFRKREK